MVWRITLLGCRHNRYRHQPWLWPVRPSRRHVHATRIPCRWEHGNDPYTPPRQRAQVKLAPTILTRQLECIGYWRADPIFTDKFSVDHESIKGGTKRLHILIKSTGEVVQYYQLTLHIWFVAEYSGSAMFPGRGKYCLVSDCEAAND